MSTTKNVLIMGATGMLGNTLFRFFSKENGFQTFGTVRSKQYLRLFSESYNSRLIPKIDVFSKKSLDRVFLISKPDVVINCVGIVKQLSASYDPIMAIPINSLFPHQLMKLCDKSNSRLIHISTDCVFSGKKGMYTELDVPDADDIYGRSKLLGEVNYKNSITLRTSIIGHELSSNRSLIDWFLSQSGSIKGYSKAIFSGIPTVELAKLILKYVIPNKELHGLFHVSSNPINKYDLLKLVSEVYKKRIDIIEDQSLIIDRSLDSSKFRSLTDFEPLDWKNLVQSMYEFK